MHELRPQGEVTDPLSPYRRVHRWPPAERPWVLANMVAGLDGSTAVGGRVGELSSPVDADLFRMLRALADVVLVGAGTVRRERYGPVRLSDHLRAERTNEGRPPVPPLAVVSRSLELDFDAPVFAEADPESPTIVLTSASAPADRVRAAEGHAEVVIAGEDQVDPAAAMAALGARGARIVLCEGGPTLLGGLVAADALDELCLTIAPVMGGDPLPVALTPDGPGPLARFRLEHVLNAGSDLFLRFERDREAA
jgi:riboflavin biosynthesis pyrimidine reductase